MQPFNGIRKSQINKFLTLLVLVLFIAGGLLTWPVTAASTAYQVASSTDDVNEDGTPFTSSASPTPPQISTPTNSALPSTPPCPDRLP
jgi:hypothetical protein